jgi:vacuolar-type H+-ATPase subunit I/STV1
MQGPEILIPLGFFATVAVVVAPLSRAYARRLGSGKEASAEVEDLRAELAELRAELDETRSRLGGSVDELHGRLDFAERMLAQGREKNVLPGAR